MLKKHSVSKIVLTFHCSNKLFVEISILVIVHIVEILAKVVEPSEIQVFIVSVHSHLSNHHTYDIQED